MIIIRTHYCGTCGENCENSIIRCSAHEAVIRCRAHEADCEKYAVGDRVEVFHQGKWWSGTVSHVLFEFPKKRFMTIRTDKQIDHNVEVEWGSAMYCGHNMYIWERTGDKTRIRRLVEQPNPNTQIKRIPDIIISHPGSSSAKRG